MVGHNHKDFSVSHCSGSIIILSLRLVLPAQSFLLRRKIIRKINSVLLDMASTSTQNTNIYIYVTFIWGLTTQFVCGHTIS